jgi:hypothetical protein
VPGSHFSGLGSTRSIQRRRGTYRNVSSGTRAIPSILKALLKVTPKDGYSWVGCGDCSGGWQVLDFAEERVG